MCILFFEEHILTVELTLTSRCKQQWGYPSVSKELVEEVICSKQLQVKLPDDVLEDVIRRSRSFSIPFPIETIRLEMLKTNRPAEKLVRNIISTYAVTHERVLILMIKFLDYKSSDGWESVGTPDEKPPLVLEDCLSYDEMKLSAMVYISGYTECINDGARHNEGVVEEDKAQDEAVIIGIMGSRFERKGRMDWEDILITKEQNTKQNGYGPNSAAARYKWRQLWADFYQVPYSTYEDLRALNMDGSGRYVKVAPEVIFDNEVYYRRLSVLAETTLLEAQARGSQAQRDVFLNVVGAGLGVWKISDHQNDVYIMTFVERADALLWTGQLTRVTDVNFGYVRAGASVLALFDNSARNETQRTLFLPCETHPKGGIRISLENREPTARLRGAHAGKLLVVTYPWDGNAHPGNEFWLGSLSGSGDPAAACSTQVSELHNAHINPALSGTNVRVAGRTGLATLHDCCLALTA